jgi:hypothetical protein
MTGEGYAREARDPELVDHAVEVRMKAEQKAGQILRDMAEKGERAKPGGDYTSEHGSARELSSPTLADLRLTKRREFPRVTLEVVEFSDGTPLRWRRGASASRAAATAATKTRQSYTAELCRPLKTSA